MIGFDDAAVDPAACTRNARRFDTAGFRAAMATEVEQAIAAEDRPAGGDRQPLATTRLVRRAVRDAQR